MEAGFPRTCLQLNVRLEIDVGSTRTTRHGEDQRCSGRVVTAPSSTGASMPRSIFVPLSGHSAITARAGRACAYSLSCARNREHIRDARNEGEWWTRAQEAEKVCFTTCLELCLFALSVPGEASAMLAIGSCGPEISKIPQGSDTVTIMTEA